MREGEVAQARAVVLLENKAVKGGRPMLPITPAGKKVFLLNVRAEAAKGAELIVVDDLHGQFGHETCVLNAEFSYFYLKEERFHRTESLSVPINHKRSARSCLQRIDLVRDGC